MKDSKALIELMMVNQQIVGSPDYYFNNAERGGKGMMVIQRTSQGCCFFEGSDGKRKIVMPGFAMGFMHGEDSRYGFPEDADSVYAHEFIAFRSGGSELLFQEIRELGGGVFALQSHSEAGMAFDKLLNAWNHQLIHDRYHVSSLIYELLISIYRSLDEHLSPGDPFDAGRRAILEHFHQPVQIQEIASWVGLSREHFTRGFQQRFHQSPAAFCRGLRMEFARALLEIPGLTLQDIARRSGYQDANVFCRAYRQFYGHAPRQGNGFAGRGT